MTHIDEHIGHRIETERRKRKLTQKALGEMVGVSFQQVQKYECAANRLSAKRLHDISLALGVPVGDFFPESDPCPK